MAIETADTEIQVLYMRTLIVILYQSPCHCRVKARAFCMLLVCLFYQYFSLTLR